MEIIQQYEYSAAVILAEKHPMRSQCTSTCLITVTQYTSMVILLEKSSAISYYVQFTEPEERGGRRRGGKGVERRG